MMPTIAEDHVRDLLEERQDGAALAEPAQRDAEQDREEQHLQDVALGERTDEACSG